MPNVHHRYATVDGQELFYREAGPADARVIVLLHGFPTSSFMFRNLIPAVADRYRVIAPDHLSFGLSDPPPVEAFALNVAHLSRAGQRSSRRVGHEPAPRLRGLRGRQGRRRQGARKPGIHRPTQAITPPDGVPVSRLTESGSIGPGADWRRVGHIRSCTAKRGLPRKVFTQMDWCTS